MSMTSNNPSVQPAVQGACAKKFGRHFTLLELMIAMVIFMMLLIVLFTAANAVTGSWERLTAEANHFSAVMSLDRTLDTVLPGIVPLRWRDAENAPIPTFYGEPDQMTFVYRHQLHNIDDGALRSVLLFVEDRTLYAIYQERPFLGFDTPSEHAGTTILAEGIERIECWYADWTPDNAVEWVDAWNTEADRFEVPLGVRIDVFWENGYQESWLRRTAGNGADEQLGVWRPAEP